MASECAECPLEQHTLHMLKDEESGRIRGDQQLAESIDRLANAYATLASRSEFDAKQLASLNDWIDEESRQRIAELDAIQRQVRDLSERFSSFQWRIGLMLGALQVAAQMVQHFLK